MAETYTLKVAGLTRELTICKVNDHMDIAAFIMLGDTELTVAAAAELLKKCPTLTSCSPPRPRASPWPTEMSRQSGKPYVCARKNVKLYMKDPVIVEDQSITTEGKQKLVIDRKELDEMSGKRVLVVDDVISTAVPSRRWTPWPSRPTARSWARPPSWRRATQPSGRISSSWSRCPCSSTDGVRRPVCALFAGALGAQLIAAFEPQAGFWAPCGSFWFCGPVLAAGGPGPRLWPLAAAGRSAGPGLFGAHRRTVQRPDGTVRRPDGAADRHGGGRPGGLHPRHRPARGCGSRTADGEAAAFCCQCDGLPLCEAGETIEGWFSLEAPAQADRPRPLRRRGGPAGGVRAGVPGAWGRAAGSGPGRPGCRCGSARRCARRWTATRPAPWPP